MLYKGEKRLLNRDLILRTSYSVSTLPAGTEIEIQQVDNKYGNVLVRHVWFYKGTIENVSSPFGGESNV